MSIEYVFHAGYGFLLPENQFALPAMWDDRELWYDGTVDKELSGSGLMAVFGGDNWSGRHLWGFVATDSYTTLRGNDDHTMIEIRDVDPSILGNLFDIRARVKRPKARIGWMMWKDVL